MPTPSTRRPLDRSLLVEHAGRLVALPARLRPGPDGEVRDLLLCLHGLGCAKESFDSAFAADPLAGLAICTFDFPGHGAAADPLPTYSIQAYADLTAAVVRSLAPDRLYLVAHSMGGAVGLVAAEELPRVLRGFVSVEGNLVAEDCGLVSRGAAELPLAEFVEQEFPQFRAALAAAPQRALRTWAGWYARTDPAAFHQVAGSLVDWSGSGKLRSLLTSLTASATATGYVHGTGSGDLSHLLPALDGTPVYPIPGSGHFPMLDNPQALWQAVAEVITAGRSAQSHTTAARPG